MNDLSQTAGLHHTPIARRGVIMSSLITGFTLAATRVEAQAIHTDTTGLITGETMVPTGEGQLPAYFARPEGAGPFPVVLVNEEIFGVHEYIKDICRRLAKAGYLAVATEYYARLGDLSKMTDPAVIVRDVVSKTPDARIMDDLDHAAAWAATQHGDPARLGMIGFCQGGRTTWLYATHNPALKAAVAFYGPLTGPSNAARPKMVVDVAADIKCPVLGLYGGQDGGIPVSAVNEVESKAKAAGKTVEMVIYPDAGHGFHADYRPTYRVADAKDGWDRMLDWLRKYLGA